MSETLFAKPAADRLPPTGGATPVSAAGRVPFRRLGVAWLPALLAVVALGCAAPSAPARRFRVPADTLSYTNQTVWEYGVDPATGRPEHRRKATRPDYALHCFAMARMTKEFFFHARFVPDAPPLDADALRRRVRRIIALGPRRSMADDPRVEVPGFAGLWELSVAHGELLREEAGGTWRSYLQRGNWRMVLPFCGAQRAREAARWADEIAAGNVAIVHVVTFPALTLNHAVLVHGARKTPDGWIFAAQDPNAPASLLEIRYDARTRRFRMPPTGYFAGGDVEAYEVYRNWIF
jgi:hypothetical protein